MQHDDIVDSLGGSGGGTSAEQLQAAALYARLQQRADPMNNDGDGVARSARISAREQHEKLWRQENPGMTYLKGLVSAAILM